MRGPSRPVRATGPAARRTCRSSRVRSRVECRVRTPRCHGGPSRPGPAAPRLSTARTSCRPSARAPLSPAMVRSPIGSRSNSASAATRRPAAVVVSICAPRPASPHRSTQRADRSCPAWTRWARLRPRRSSFPIPEHAALPQGAEAIVESRPVVSYAGSEVVVEVGRVVDTRGPQGVALQVQRLGTILF